MTNRRRLESCRQLWPLRPGSALQLPEQEYKTAKQFDFWFSWFYLVERVGVSPASINNRNLGCDWTRKNYASSLWFAGLGALSGDMLSVRTFNAPGHISVAIIHFVNLFHASERFFELTHSLVDQAEIVQYLLLHRVHG